MRSMSTSVFAVAVLVIEVLNVFIAGEHWIAVDFCRDLGIIVQVLCPFMVYGVET